ncbi:relaxase MobL, partial [Clostridioides difficile]
MSTPGVIHKSRFVISTSEEFKNYIDYVDRDEAIRNNAYSRYSAYNDYMGNPEKTSALFTQDRNFLRDKDKEKVKDLFSIAQSKKSIMWQDVFSFNNAWLEKVGFYDRRTKDIDEEKIKNAVRASMKYWFEEDGLDGSAIWSAAIHYNTDNIHIHIATCELNPLKQRGKRTLKTLENMKSKFVNNLCNEKESYK